MPGIDLSFSPLGDENFAKKAECSECLNVWVDPIQLQPCGHTFCRTCVGETRHCPMCRTAVTARSVPDQSLVNQAADLQVQCDRCNAVMPNKERRAHVCPPKEDAAAAAQPAAPMQIFVRLLKGTTIVFRVTPNDTCGSVAKQIMDREGIPEDLQRLIFSGKQLDGESTLAHYNVQNNSTLQLVLRMRGGRQGFVRTLTGKTITWELQQNDNCGSITAKHEDTKGHPDAVIFTDQLWGLLFVFSCSE
jgi:hypothetical protein